MEDSILDTIKKMLGITSEQTYYDTDVTIHINSVFSILEQLGMKSFSISNSDAKWSDYIPDGKSLEDVKTYVYLKVKLIFDPPTSSSAVSSIKELISELEWRINVAVDTDKEVVVDV